MFLLDLIQHLSSVEKKCVTNPLPEINWLIQTEEPEKVYAKFHNLKCWAEEQQELVMKASPPSLIGFAESLTKTSGYEQMEEVQPVAEVGKIGIASTNFVGGKRVRK